MTWLRRLAWAFPFVAIAVFIWWTSWFMVAVLVLILVVLAEPWRWLPWRLGE